MAMDTTTSATSSDSLLPGKGHTPNYGITETEDSDRFTKRVQYTDSPDRWRVVAMCVSIACLASMVAGMSLSFSSIIISELSSTPANTAWRITKDSIHASLIGVSGIMCVGGKLSMCDALPAD